MQPRIDYTKLSPGGYKAMLGLELYLNHSGLEKELLHMIKLRVSQINGCAFCLDMHWKDLQASGESEQRMYSLDAWRETDYYSDRERPRWPWRKRSRRSRKAMCLTKCSKRHVNTSVNRKWLT